MKSKEFILAPSILSADFTNLGRDVITAVEAGAQYIHIDVMDGMYVPQISFGGPVIKALRPLTDAVFDVHMMVEEPGRYVEKIRALRAMIDERGLDVRIEIDGGVKASNIKRLADCGVDIFVAGSAVFEGDITANMKEIMEQLA